MSICMWNLRAFPTMQEGVRPLRFVPSSTGLPSKRCPSIGFLSRADREIGVFRRVAPTTRLRLEFPRETGLILRCVGAPIIHYQKYTFSCFLDSKPRPIQFLKKLHLIAIYVENEYSPFFLMIINITSFATTTKSKLYLFGKAWPFAFCVFAVYKC